MLSEVTEVEGEKQKIRTNSSVSVRLEKNSEYIGNWKIKNGEEIVILLRMNITPWGRQHGRLN